MFFLGLVLSGRLAKFWSVPLNFNFDLWCCKKENFPFCISIMIGPGQSVVPIHQGYGFDPQSGHIQESTDKWIHKWNNKFLSLFLSLSLFSLKSTKT